MNKNVKYTSPKEQNLIKFKNNIIKKVFNVDLVGGSNVSNNTSVEIVEVRTPFKNKLSILNHIKNNYDLTNRKKINIIFLNEQNKPETIVVNTQMMKNYLKHVNDYSSQELPTTTTGTGTGNGKGAFSKGAFSTGAFSKGAFSKGDFSNGSINKNDENNLDTMVNKRGGNINNNYSLSFLIMQ